ncbi:hypothetical protein BGZ99_003065 [Dissophora globulifera]|uniref:Uncharacterized protein n=1 Tax=Dissophora globulifera TaxID=979702 RepID=A0A9P6RV79_9FUNG|nr:hypothetical protein BGZ99_003065 [Dissophora globulifera]
MDDNDADNEDGGDDDQTPPTFLLSSQDFEPRPSFSTSSSSRRHRLHDRIQDDFFLVEPSDLDPSSRPHSSLSNRSDSHPDDTMGFIYPSMMLSHSSEAPSLPLGKAQDAVGDKVSLAQEASHAPAAHDIPATIDSSLETLSGTPQPTLTFAEQHHQPRPESRLDQHQGSDQTSQTQHDEGQLAQDHADDSTSLSGTTELSPIPAQVADTDTAHNVRESKESSSGISGASNTQRKSVKSLFDSVAQEDYSAARPTPGSGFIAINPVWNLKGVLAGCFGFLSLLVLIGFLAAEYYHSTTTPAHVVVSEINYAEFQRVTYVLLDVYTSRLTQEQRPNRPPGFHVRVLADDKPWTLKEAPAQALQFPAEPIVTCVWGGYCQIFIPTFLPRDHKIKSPQVCTDTSYYLHIWFRNGTRISDRPIEIFTTRGHEGKSQECYLRPAATVNVINPPWGAEDEADEADDYLDYWKEQMRRAADSVVHGYTSLSAIWTDRYSETIQLATQSMINMVLELYQQSSRLAARILMQWREAFSESEGDVLDRASAAVLRAQGNAKQITSRAAAGLRKLTCQFSDQAFRDGRHSSPYGRTFKDQLDKLSAKKVLRKADQLLHKAEYFLADVEDNFDTWMAEKANVDMRGIKREADRLALKAEAKIVEALNSKLARNINGNVKHKLDQLKATSAGDKLVREADAVKKDVKRRWKDLQRQLQQW